MEFVVIDRYRADSSGISCSARRSSRRLGG